MIISFQNPVKYLFWDLGGPTPTNFQRQLLAHSTQELLLAELGGPYGMLWAQTLFGLMQAKHPIFNIKEKVFGKRLCNV